VEGSRAARQNGQGPMNNCGGLEALEAVHVRNGDCASAVEVDRLEAAAVRPMKVLNAQHSEHHCWGDRICEKDYMHAMASKAAGEYGLASRVAGEHMLASRGGASGDGRESAGEPDNGKVWRGALGDVTESWGVRGGGKGSLFALAGGFGVLADRSRRRHREKDSFGGNAWQNPVMG
jgi:hypothetical protein